MHPRGRSCRIVAVSLSASRQNADTHRSPRRPRTAGVRLQTRGGKKSAAALTDKGFINHPVFGNREVWVNRQQVQSGWWTEPTRVAGPTVRREIESAMADVAVKIGRRI